VTTTSTDPAPVRGQFAGETSAGGEWTRQANHFTGRISRDSSSAPGGGPDDQGRWPVEAGRYRLVVCLACPWAHRSLIVRGLLGLEDAISLAVVDPLRDEAGWRFWLDEGHRDPELGIEFLSEAYHATDPSFAGRVTVPCIVDTLSGRVVTNDYPQITLDLSTEWVDHHRPGAPDLWPADLRADMQPVIDDIYADVNNGVYRCGFATEQAAYEQAYDRLFARLDELEQRLASSRFLMGEQPREVDVRLFTTLVRFDACVPRPLQDQPEQAHRDAPSLALRPRAVRPARLGEHRRLRPHQAALLRHAQPDQPDRHRPEGPAGVGLARGHACADRLSDTRRVRP
jgi:putative glutathione S-transferase